MPVGARVDDHHNGRCVGIPVVVGARVNVPTGEAWLRGLPESRQRRIMGPSAFRAWQQGAVNLNEFVDQGHDPVFGRMVFPKSLKGILGNRATQFYGRN